MLLIPPPITYTMDDLLIDIEAERRIRPLTPVEEEQTPIPGVAVLPGSWDYEQPLNTDWPTTIEQEAATQATAANWDEPAPGQITKEDLASILSGSPPTPQTYPAPITNPQASQRQRKRKGQRP
jgi:hypothetical protein